MSSSDWGLAHFAFMFAVTVFGFACLVIYVIGRFKINKLAVFVFLSSAITIMCVIYWALTIAYDHGWLQT
ncbi:hypothetical protein [Erwinia phage vB_Ea277G]|jgi:hypothetical protein|nr:hypothetical protein [Erwinia phage vB_Ea277G]